MLNTFVTQAKRSSRPTLMSIVMTTCLTLLGSSAIAEQSRQDTEVVVERPVVVVRSTTNHPHLTWTVAGSRSFLGVQTVDLTPELREHFGVPREAGVLVAKIVDESPAAETDLQVGDIISAVDEEDITSPSALARAVGHHDAGDVIDLEVWRDGKIRKTQSTLVEHHGPAVDIRQFRLSEGRLESFSLSEAELEGAIELETETLNRAIERLNKEMNSPEWEKRVHSFHEHQDTLMKRIRVLEKRLKELEKELGQLADEE